MTMTDPNQPPEAAPVPWAQQAAVKAEQATKRIRRVVQSLPDWEPMPPGELIVRRPRHES
jgi:hypothetical protein